ncbi:MAG: peroxiredoxin [Saprospiraceae bacterium]|jgi:peroxiredoxin
MRIIVILLFFALQMGTSQSRDVNKKQSSTDSLTLYLFLLDDCPICLNYTTLLNDLYTEYGSRISFLGYFPNFSSKPKKIDFFKKTYGIEFPLQTDYHKAQAKKWNAVVTPEVILYNNTTKKIIYQGRIDNKFVRLGKRRNIVTEHELINAIEQTLDSKEVLTPYAEPIGCFINYNDNISRNK